MIKKRLREKTIITKAVFLLSNLFHRLLRFFFFSMDNPILLPYDDNTSYDFPLSFVDPGESWFLVSFSWLEEAVCSGEVLEGEIGSVIRYVAGVNLLDDLIGDSQIVLSMMTGDDDDDDDDVGGRGKENNNNTLALVSEWIFFSSLKWY